MTDPFEKFRQAQEAAESQITKISIPGAEEQEFAGVMGVVVLANEGAVIVLTKAATPQMVHTLGHAVNNLGVQMIENPESVLPNPSDPRWKAKYTVTVDGDASFVVDGDTTFVFDGRTGEVEEEQRILLGFGGLAEGGAPEIELHVNAFVAPQIDHKVIVGMRPVWLSPSGTISVEDRHVIGVKTEQYLS